MNGTKAILLLAVLISIPLAGCSHGGKKTARDTSLDRRLIASIVDEQAVEAIERQHSIFPYHFFPGTAYLNELGRRDLAILSEHEHPGVGVLHIRRNRPESHVMYAARVKAVRDFLEGQGIAVFRTTFDEDWPGGDGERAETAAMFLERPQMAAPAAQYGLGAPALTASPQGVSRQ